MTGKKPKNNKKNTSKKTKDNKVLTWLNDKIFSNIDISSKYLLITSLTGISFVISILIILGKYELLDFSDKILMWILVVIFSISIYILLILPAFIKQKKIQRKIVGIGIGLIGIVRYMYLVSEYKEYKTISILFVIIFLFFLFWIIVDFAIIVYRWLWINKDDKDTKQIDTTKLNLLWLILAFILGLVFNIKK